MGRGRNLSAVKQLSPHYDFLGIVSNRGKKPLPQEKAFGARAILLYAEFF